MADRTWMGYDDEDDTIREVYDSSKDCILFMIEANETMLADHRERDSAKIKGKGKARMDIDGEEDEAEDDDEEQGSLMLRALRLVYKTVAKKLKQSPADKIGVTIFGVAEMCSLNHEGIQTLIKLSEPSVEMLTLLEDIIAEATANPDHLSNVFQVQSRPNINIVTAMAAVSLIFRSKVALSASRRLVWITDNDEPYKADSFSSINGFRTAAKNSFTRANDVYELDVDLIPCLIPRFIDDEDGFKFDVTKYYETMLSPWIPSEEAQSQVKLGKDPFEGMEEITVKLISKKRAAFSIPFEIAPGLTIGIQGFNDAVQAKAKPPIKIDRSGGKVRETKSLTQYFDLDSGEQLDPRKNTRTFRPIAGKPKSGGSGEGRYPGPKVIFDDDVLASLKALGLEPSLCLLSFAPRRLAPPIGDQIKHSVFIYPDEKKYEGSTRTFSALLKSMVKGNLIAFGVIQSRKRSTPRHVYMIPQQEKTDDETGEMIDAPGLHVYWLPYRDDRREHPEIKTQQVWYHADHDADTPNNLRELANKMLKSINRSKYDPDLYPNPRIDRQHEVLLATARNTELPDASIDATVPLYDSFEQRAGATAKLFNETLDANPNAHIHVDVGVSKRKRSDVEAQAASKKAKLAAPDDAEERLVTLLTDDSHKDSKMTNPIIRAYLDANNGGGKSGDNKATLLEKARAVLVKKGLIDED